MAPNPIVVGGEQGTGVRIIGPVGIGKVQMTTFFYRTKSLLKISFRIFRIFVGWGFNRR